MGATALVVMVRRLADAVAYACDEGYAAIVYGGDSAVLLGCLAGAGEKGGVVRAGRRERQRARGAHRASPDGAAAGSAVSLALSSAPVDGEVTGARRRDLLPGLRPGATWRLRRPTRR